MSNSMIIKQPQLVMVNQHSADWGSGICDCCQDVPECCCAFWCWPCYACKVSKAYGEAFCLPLLDVFCHIMIPPVTLAMRVSMRHRYGIAGNFGTDCFYATFCTICTWSQMSREMKSRNIPVILVSAKSRT